MAVAVTALLTLPFIACENSYFGDQSAQPPGAETPTITVAREELEDLSGQQLMKRASEQLQGLHHLEATYTAESVSAEGTKTAHSKISLESWRRFRILTERSDGADRFEEKVFANGKLYMRRAATFAEMETMRWEESFGRPQLPWTVIDIFEELSAPDALETDDHYLLVGSVLDPQRGASPPPQIPHTHDRIFEGGEFEARIDSETFAPQYVTYDMAVTSQAIVDEAESHTKATTVTVEFISLNEQVTVTPPPQEFIDLPTKVASPTPTPTPTPGAER